MEGWREKNKESVSFLFLSLSLCFGAVGRITFLWLLPAGTSAQVVPVIVIVSIFLMLLILVVPFVMVIS